MTIEAAKELEDKARRPQWKFWDKGIVYQYLPAGIYANGDSRERPERIDVNRGVDLGPDGRSQVWVHLYYFDEPKLNVFILDQVRHLDNHRTAKEGSLLTRK